MSLSYCITPLYFEQMFIGLKCYLCSEFFMTLDEIQKWQIEKVFYLVQGCILLKF